MAYTQDDIDALKVAIASGVKKVKFSDRETEYRDLSEMRQILSDMQASVSNKRREPYRPKGYSREYQ